MNALYDRIGIQYADYRRPDPRINALIAAALGDAVSIVNVGAGAGSYEPKDREIVAVEPSATMIAQRAPDAAMAVQGDAQHLPFADNSFDTAMALLTVHHWPDLDAGIAELVRVARRRCVIFTWEPSPDRSWLTRDYFPEIWEYDLTKFPPVRDYERFFDKMAVIPVPIPHDCTDGFLEAYWRRPETYFDEGVRRAISSFARLRNLKEGLERLRRDLGDGTWERRNGHLRMLDELVLGYRIIVGDLDTKH
jgi:SAM-dependent methyltransferase